MSNLIEIQSKIVELQKQANEIKAREFDKTVQEILVKMQAFGIALKDLHPGKARGAKARSKVVAPPNGEGRKPKKKSTSAVVAKYRGPNGEMWSGRGLTPRWLAALVTQGKTREEFAIKN